MIKDFLDKIRNKSTQDKTENEISTYDSKVEYNIGDELLYPTRWLLIASKLLNGRPGAEKYKKHLDYFKQHGEVDKPIEVFINDRGRFVVIDKYIRLLINENHGVKMSKIKIVAKVGE